MVPSPATAPEMMPSTEGLPRPRHSIAIQVKAPAQAARCVTSDRHAGARPRAERRAAVEPEPADPEQARADHRHRKVIGRKVFFAKPAPLP